MRQYEIRKRLDEVYKVELVRRVRVSAYLTKQGREVKINRVIGNC